ncbi:MAG: glycosyltransferase family 2 protein [Opitutaceae bacterium]
MFSVIIPTYNRADTICESLDSVVAQTYRPIEIIVVDDGSTDDTETVIEKWSTLLDLNNQESTQKIEKRANAPQQTAPLSLRYVKQENGGAPSARNRGIKELGNDSKFVQFLDSDDRLHPERFAILARAFEEQNADFIQTSIEWFDPESGETVNKLKARPNADQVELVLQGDFWANTLRGALRKDLVENIGQWSVQMTCFQDRDYMERAVMQAKNPIALEPILGYLARGAGMHVSNIHRTYEGRQWRIYSERRLVEQVLQRNDLNEPIKAILASRIFRIGCRSAVSGWYDYARECADIGDMLQVKHSTFAKFKRKFCRMGAVGAFLYKLVCMVKNTPSS